MRSTRVALAVALTAAALGAGTVPASGQSPPNEPTGRGRMDVPGWDFNGDGYADLPVGVPGENLTVNGSSIADAGAVNVVYGSPRDGLSATYVPEQFWHQNSTGVSDTVEAGDEFGFALTGGDFNGDGYDELAVGAPGETYAGIPDAGVVNVIYGSSSGLSTRPMGQLWHQGKAPGDLGSGDRFGHSLTTGDFNADGYDDLAVGAPYDDYAGDGQAAVPDGGAVTVIYGGPTGLGSSPALPAQAWTQNSAPELVPADDGDLFGWALTAGLFDADGITDLAIGVPFEWDCFGSETNEPVPETGAVDAIHGSPTGLFHHVSLADRPVAGNVRGLRL